MSHKNKIRVLILGCGNIGALYDWKLSDKVWTHVKAFCTRKEFDVVVADQNDDLAKKVARKYKIASLKFNELENFDKFDIVSITTPTHTHEKYLTQSIKSKVPLILCEKPISLSKSSLIALRKAYLNGESKILVNYIRRFQPAYFDLQTRILNLSKVDECVQIVIKYKRGVVNNGSHAFDLLQYLFNKEIVFKNYVQYLKNFDAFDNDPTVSGSFLYGKIPVTLIGLSQISYPVFEIEIYFQNNTIYISDSGNSIIIKQIKLTENVRTKTEILGTEILNDYMLPVVNRTYDLFENKLDKDNFIESVDLNLNIIQNLLNKN